MEGREKNSEPKKDRSEGTPKPKTKRDGTSVKSEGSFKKTFLEHIGLKKITRSESQKTKMETMKGTTMTDANMMTRPEYEKEREVQTEMVVGKYDEEYKMDHKNRGKAIILNHEYFEREEPREGTKKDVDKLQHTLKQLGFDVEVYQDLDYSNILMLLKEISRDDHTDNDCIAFFILTHGNKKREISAKDIYYPVEKLWDNFTADNCLSLAGKPKLFFINACRGEKRDKGVKFFRGRTQSDSVKQDCYKIPAHADFLIAQSSVDGYLSYRDITNGTWFIQCLCDMLLEHHNTKDILKILTLTARRVAIDYRPITENPADSECTQVPSFTSMLIRDLYLRTS